MAAKALLLIDMEIARLREECEHASTNCWFVVRLRELLDERDELVPRMLAERWNSNRCVVSS